jgi:hypothetical protein
MKHSKSSEHSRNIKAKPFARLSKGAHQYLSAKNNFSLIKKAEDSL